mmetsp:Transcript_65675/g.58950  ORF Transcript_65675/g.58950 Transcript_65675/m.58950 type:complete len:281 (-) Transcript_65675:94-936(-)|eukprot:CAMPEP_0201574558 /NCGR_PEP_ID=MMETSP0190_2-20130828/19118_1 /ASSEMBLY_ACC=CAM_ASM_000263 /TAXON_ID=37353 /ORGANISM="Rosalina sp." /LENGTH=280 /DNA_ID=CAMNT_0048002945 /DNA_START=78 /DNA_END=920 /DNA_ORIENTATION=-
MLSSKMNQLFIAIITLSIFLQNCNGFLGFSSIKDRVYQEIADKTKSKFEELKSEMQNSKVGGEIIKCKEDSAAEIGDLFNSVKQDGIILYHEMKDKFGPCKDALAEPVKDILTGLADGDIDSSDFIDVLHALKNECTGVGEKTLTIEVATSESIGIGMSQSLGFAFDFKEKKVYFYVAACVNAHLGAGVDAGIAMYSFEKYGDVAGCSKYYSIGQDVASVTVDGIIVFNVPTTTRIAIGMDISGGMGVSVSDISKKIPSVVGNAEYGHCFTIDPFHIGGW